MRTYEDWAGETVSASASSVVIERGDVVALVALGVRRRVGGQIVMSSLPTSPLTDSPDSRSSPPAPPTTIPAVAARQVVVAATTSERVVAVAAVDVEPQRVADRLGHDGVVAGEERNADVFDRHEMQLVGAGERDVRTRLRSGTR